MIVFDNKKKKKREREEREREGKLIILVYEKEISNDDITWSSGKGRKNCIRTHSLLARAWMGN